MRITFVALSSPAASPILSTRWSLMIVAGLTCLLTWLAWNTNAPRMGLLLTHPGDPLGYYQWLPGTFLNGDWSTLPYVHYLPSGKGLSLFTMGVAVMQAPFFLLARLYCTATGIPVTGFELPFVFARLMASAFYCSAGLALVYQTLRRYWGAGVAGSTCLLILVGTNLYYYSVHDGGMSHVYSFFLFGALLNLTHGMLEKPSGVRLLGLVFCGALLVLIRPLNGVALLVPVLYGAPPRKALRLRWQWIMTFRRWFVLAAIAALILILPQLMYWEKQTGSLIAFTYGSKNEGFFWLDAHLWDILFSHQGGWLLYHPIMIGAIVALAYKAYEKGGTSSNWRVLLAVWGLAWYAYASWWNWWLGGSFGHRGFVEHYAYLALPFAVFVNAAVQWFGRWRWLLLIITGALVFLNIRMSLLAYSPMDGPTWTWRSLIKMWADAFFI